MSRHNRDRHFVNRYPADNAPAQRTNLEWAVADASRGHMPCRAQPTTLPCPCRSLRQGYGNDSQVQTKAEEPATIQRLSAAVVWWAKPGETVANGEVLANASAMAAEFISLGIVGWSRYGRRRCACALNGGGKVRDVTLPLPERLKIASRSPGSPTLAPNCACVSGCPLTRVIQLVSISFSGCHQCLGIAEVSRSEQTRHERVDRSAMCFVRIVSDSSDFDRGLRTTL